MVILDLMRVMGGLADGALAEVTTEVAAMSLSTEGLRGRERQLVVTIAGHGGDELTHIGQEVVDVVDQVRPDEIPVCSRRENLGKPRSDAADLMLHIVDRRESELAPEALGEPVRRDL